MTARPEPILPEISAGTTCAWKCGNLHGQPLKNGKGDCRLTWNKNGKLWQALCQTCCKTVAQTIIDAPIAPPQISCQEISSGSQRQAGGPAVILLDKKIYQSESELNFDIFDHFGAVSWMRLWRNNVGAAKIKDVFVKFGVKSSGDIQGILNYAPNHGRFLSWESKIEGHYYEKKHMKRQADYRTMVTDFGGIAVQGFQVSDFYTVLAAVGVHDLVLQGVYDAWKARQR